MKKMMSTVLVFALVLSICLFGSTDVLAAGTVTEYPVTGGNIYFNTQTGVVTDCDESVTAADIPTSIEEVKVVGIGGSAFANCDSLESVTIPDSVMHIAGSAFSSCGMLISVTIPDSVTTIGRYAFSNCGNLNRIIIPNSVVTIEEKAFADCVNLTSVTIPNGVKSISSETFYCCYNLRSVTIPESVTEIAGDAFEYCDMLTDIFYMGSEAQWQTVKKVDNTFSNATVHYQASGDEEFLINYPVTSGNIVFNKLTGMIVDCEKSVTVADIPAEINGVAVTRISNVAFYGCKNLTEVTIPKGVKTIGERAFGYCSSLKSVTIPEGVTYIGSKAFSHCTNLSKVKIPDSVTKIEAWAFEECDRLMSITLPNGLVVISPNLFSGCDNLTFVTIPVSVERIDSFIFENCRNLTAIYYVGEIWEWNCIDVWENALADIGTDVVFVYGMEGPEDLELWEYFFDLPDTDNWAYDGILYCIENGLMNGTSTTKFSPNGTVSRAQLVTILYRVAGSPETEFKGTFTDVPGGKWYSKAIEWAAANGVVNGIGNGKFGPDQSITREQIATILYRYEKEPAVSGNLSSFPDHKTVSGFAENGLIWATNEKLINGISSGGVTTLAPKSNATRAQIASIIMRYLEN